VELANFLPRVKNFNFAVTEEDGKVIFLRRIMPGGTDKSYGIHVAQLAGLPRSVIHRAEEVLSNLENGRQRNGSHREREGCKVLQPQQLPLLAVSSPLADELVQMEVDAMTPHEALTKLYELKQKAKQEL
jgi:DNA mismatch repair protein MutS